MQIVRCGVGQAWRAKWSGNGAEVLTHGKTLLGTHCNPLREMRHIPGQTTRGMMLDLELMF